MGSENVSMEEMEEYDLVVKQLFKSEEDGCNFYNNLAACKGFGTRLSDVKYKKGTDIVYWRQICCACEGFRQQKHFGRNDRVRDPRKLSRCGCLAKLEIKFCEEKGFWFVSNYVDKHNHEFAKNEQVPFIRSQRALSDAQKAEAMELGLGGLQKSQIMEAMENSHGGYDKVGFVSKDLYNFFRDEKKMANQGSDVDSVLSHMNAKKEEDVEFFFKYSVGDEGRLKNLFWSDSQSQRDYDAFGGVVIFDSTYRVNRYNHPIVPFVGVNHHRGTVIFGCGIISDETVDSYVWLLEAFLEAMRQDHPRSVITDGDNAMAKAIALVMPGTDHRLCSWHIDRNTINHLRGAKLKDFRRLIYNAVEVDEFERRWADFMKKHKIREDDVWISRMYASREKWSMAYTKGRYFLGMQSNQRSESLNSRLHLHIKRTMSLMELVKQYEFCLSRVRKNEVEQDAKTALSVPYTEISADPLEKRAARIYTPTIFKMVRQQIQELLEWQVDKVAQEDTVFVYEVMSKANSEHRVNVRCAMEGSLLSSAECHCRKLESEDIPCAHIFSIVKYLGLDSIPPCLIMARWTMKAKLAFESERKANAHVWSEQMERFRELRNIGNEVFFKASKSADKSKKMKHLLQSDMDDGSDDGGETKPTSFGPMPPHFSESNGTSRESVVEPMRKISKGAPSKRRKALQESWKKSTKS